MYEYDRKWTGLGSIASNHAQEKKRKSTDYNPFIHPFIHSSIQFSLWSFRILCEKAIDTSNTNYMPTIFLGNSQDFDYDAFASIIYVNEAAFKAFYVRLREVDVAKVLGDDEDKFLWRQRLVVVAAAGAPSVTLKPETEWLIRCQRSLQLSNVQGFWDRIFKSSSIWFVRSDGDHRCGCDCRRRPLRITVCSRQHLRE